MDAAEIVGIVVLGILAVLGIVAVSAGVGLLLAFPVKWTWNATMPYLFAWPAITWGKAWCLMFLSSCLIKGRVSAGSSTKS